MKYLFVLIFILAKVTPNHAQDKLTAIASFSYELEEISGMHYSPEKELLWAINDAGNRAVVYGLDPKTALIKHKVFLETGFNADWEDIAHNLDTLYIADTGNNDFNREFFTVYILKPDTNAPNTVVKTEAITIDFPDDAKKKDNIRFDVEAMIYWQGELFFFTKTNRGKFKDRTKVFCASARPGRQKAVYLGAYELCGKEENCKITGAAIHEQSGTLALISPKNLYVITNFNKELSFKNGQKTRYEFNEETQKEGVTFISSKSVFISEEKNKGKNKLYKFSWD